MQITPALLESACACSSVNGLKYAGPLTLACTRYAITSPQRQAAFLAQIAHESGSLSTLAESFDYIASALSAVFPRVMNPSIAMTMDGARMSGSSRSSANVRSPISSIPTATVAATRRAVMAGVSAAPASFR